MLKLSYLRSPSCLSTAGLYRTFLHMQPGSRSHLRVGSGQRRSAATLRWPLTLLSDVRWNTWRTVRRAFILHRQVRSVTPGTIQSLLINIHPLLSICPHIFSFIFLMSTSSSCLVSNDSLLLPSNDSWHLFPGVPATQLPSYWLRLQQPAPTGKLLLLQISIVKLWTHTFLCRSPPPSDVINQGHSPLI